MSVPDRACPDYPNECMHPWPHRRTTDLLVTNDQGETEMAQPSEIQFTGTGESCTEVTAFLGGSKIPPVSQWKSCTNDGGYVLTPNGREEFNPGDWIVRDESGAFRVRRSQP